MLAPVQLTAEELALVKQHYHGSECEQIRLRAHAIFLSHQGYSFSQTGEILMVSEETIYRYLKNWQKERLASLFPKYLGNQHAAKLTKQQKQQLKEVLSQPPSGFGIPGKFWDVFSLRRYVKAEFGVEYESEESYRLIFLLHNYSFHLPATFDKHRDEKKIAGRMKEIKKEIGPYLNDPL